MTRSLATLVVAPALVMGLASCGAPEPDGPPRLRLGQDECVECGMIISDDRFAASREIVEARGRRFEAFDDLGCLFDRERSMPEVRAARAWVGNHAGGGWVQLESAVLVASDEMHTPMGFGVAAYSSSAEAVKAAERLKGSIIDQAAARERRAAQSRRRTDG